MCDLTHVGVAAPSLRIAGMEWVLQVVDEIDDVIGAMRHGWVGFTAPIGAMMSSFGAALKFRGWRLRAQP